MGKVREIRRLRRRVRIGAPAIHPHPLADPCQRAALSVELDSLVDLVGGEAPPPHGTSWRCRIALTVRRSTPNCSPSWQTVAPVTYPAMSSWTCWLSSCLAEPGNRPR